MLGVEKHTRSGERCTEYPWVKIRMIFGEPEPGEPIKKVIDSVDFHFALVIVIRMEQDRLRAWVLALERGP